MRIRQMTCWCLLTAALLGCQPAASPLDSQLHVLAAETFLADIAQNVAGDRLVIESLVPPGADPHEYQITPQDAVRLEQARLLIVNGLGYESWLEQSLGDGASDRIVVEASSGVIPAVEGDPHQWMYPLNVVTYTLNIRDALTQVDPDGRSTYAANADAYIAQLEELDEWIRAQVGEIPSGRRRLVTNHDALQSFARAYGFEIAGVVVPGYSSDGAPSAQEMAALIQVVRANFVTAIFVDIGENPDLAGQIAAETGAHVIPDLYIETLSDGGGPAPTYLDMLKHDVALIVEALR